VAILGVRAACANYSESNRSFCLIVSRFVGVVRVSCCRSRRRDQGSCRQTVELVVDAVLASGQEMSVAVEDDRHRGVSGPGGDLSGRCTGGDPQRDSGVTEIVIKPMSA
jgi:hypothetical protein